MPPPTIARLSLIAAGLTTFAGMAYAEDLAGSSTADAAPVFDCGELVDPDDPDILTMTWSDSLDDAGNPFLVLRMPDHEGLSAQLEVRVAFRGESVTWTDTLRELTAYAEHDVALSLPETARFDAAQADWLSTLVVRVTILDSEGTALFTRQAPFMKVAWDGDGALILDQATAEALAPGGAWSAAAQDSVDLWSTSDDDDYVTSYGEID